MDKEDTKLNEMLELANTILSDIEFGTVPLESIISKAKRLARLRDDLETIKWLSLELVGYDNQTLPDGINREDLLKYARRAGRNVMAYDAFTKKNIEKYYVTQVSELESNIKNDEIRLANLKLPAQFTPAVRKYSSNTELMGAHSGEEVVESYQNVVDKIESYKQTISQRISTNKGLISKIRNSIHDYVTNINYQLRFENIQENIFQQSKHLVDLKLKEMCPEAIKQFVSVYDRLKSENPEDHAQALLSCRRILLSFADSIFPAQDTPYTDKSGRARNVREDDYKNRLWAFIDKNCGSDSKENLLKSRVEDLGNRVDAIYEMTCKGIHKKKIDQDDVNMCVIDTYLLIGSLLKLI